MTTNTATITRKVNPADFDCEMVDADTFIREDGAIEAHRVSARSFVLLTEDGSTFTTDDGEPIAVSLLTALRIMRDFDEPESDHSSN